MLTREQQIEILSNAIDGALTLRALLAAGTSPEDWDYSQALSNPWNGFLLAAGLCADLANERRRLKDVSERKVPA